MKEKELRQHADCNKCGQKIGHTGLPVFHLMKFESYGLDAQAIQQQQGLGMMIGATIAMHMGPDKELAHKIGENHSTLCHHCFCEVCELIGMEI